MAGEKGKSAPDGGACVGDAVRCVALQVSDQQLRGVAVGDVITAQVDADARALQHFTAACCEAELHREITSDARADVGGAKALIAVGLLGRGYCADALRGGVVAAVLFVSSWFCGAVAGDGGVVGIRHGGFRERTTSNGPRGGRQDWLMAAGSDAAGCVGVAACVAGRECTQAVAGAPGM